MKNSLLSLFTFAVLVISSVNAEAVQEMRFTKEQQYWLDLAYVEGSKIGWPETIQAILLQESTAGVNGPVGDIGNGFGKRSYCPMQVTIRAARDVLRSHPELDVYPTDEELLVALLSNDLFCMRMGALYFALMLDRTRNWSQAVLAYNRGASGARSWEDPVQYLPGIREHIKLRVRNYNTYVRYYREGERYVNRSMLEQRSVAAAVAGF